MNIAKEKQELISYQVIKILVSRFDSFPEDTSSNRNAPFHEAFLNAFSNKLQDRVTDIPFLLSLSSWLHGLNTTLGQTFFEAVAHILSYSGKKEFTSKRGGTLQLSRNQNDQIGKIITDLSNDIVSPNLSRENILIFEDNNADCEMVNSIDFSADVFIEDDETITAIELKSVRPNSGEMRGEKDKILQGKAALSKRYVGKTIEFFIGFPFDPTETNGPDAYDKDRFTSSIINMNKYFSHDEVLLSAELWDFLSGHTNTMQDLLAIINNIATIDFMENLQYILDNSKKYTSKYSEILNQWKLFSELELIHNDPLILDRICNDRKLQRLYNKPCFNTKGEYSIDRYMKLRELM